MVEAFCTKCKHDVGPRNSCGTIIDLPGCIIAYIPKFVEWIYEAFQGGSDY